MSNRLYMYQPVIAICAFLISLAAPGCMTEVYLDAVKEVPESYHLGTAVAPEPVWSKTIMAQETDIIRYLDRRHLLVGTLRVTTHWHQIHMLFDRLLCFDISTGDTVWSISRDSLGQRFQSLLTAMPAITIIGESESGRILTIIDPLTGRTMVSLPVTGVPSLIEHGETILVLNVGHDTLFVENLSLNDGRKRWSCFFPGMAEDSKQPMALDIDSLCLVSGKWTVALLSANGSAVWKLSQPLGDSKLLVTSGYILVGDSAQTKAIRTSTGEIVWTCSTENIQQIGSDGSRAFLITGKSGGIEIQAHDLLTGALVWEKPLDQIHSPIVFDSASTYLSTGYDVVALRLNDGTQRFSLHIDPTISTSTGLPDLLSIRGSRLYLARERGIVAWDISNGEHIYSVPLGGSIAGTLDYHTNKLLAFSATTAGNSSILTGPHYSAIQLNGLRNWAQSYQQYVTTSTQASVQSGTMSRTSAANQREFAIREAQAMSAAEADIQFGVDLMQFAMAIRGAIVAYSVELMKPWIANQMQMIQAVQNGYRSIYGHMFVGEYFIRPTVCNGIRLSVIRLNDGHRADIQLIPGVEPFNGPDGWHVPAFAASPDKRSVSVFGFIPDTTRYSTYDLAFHLDMRDTVRNWKIPYPFIMNLPLDRMSFQPSAAPIPEPVSFDTSAKALTLAAFTGDYDKVKSLLDMGVSPNVRNEFGYTPLLLAAQRLNSDIVELLLDRGADVTLSDEEGVNAADYVTYPPKPPSKATTDVLIALAKAYAKRMDEHNKK